MDGIVNGGASARWIGGPLVGGLLYGRFGYVVPFAVSIALAAGALLLAAWLIQETYTPAAHTRHAPAAWTQGWQALPVPSTFVLLLLIAFGVMFAWAFIEPQFMFYAYEDLNWSSFHLGLVMSTYGVACMVGEFGLGQLSDRLGRKPVLVLGLALFSAQFVGLVLFREVAWIGVSFVLAGLGNALYDPPLNALLPDMTPSDQTAGVLGLKSTAGSLGSLLGPALVVQVTPLVSPQIVFLMAAALVCMLTLAAGWVLHTPRVSEAAQTGV
jgi:DHA1 family multidrug resistance protein-like MFS transporter